MGTFVPRFLVCSPNHYDVSESINVHMRPDAEGGRPEKSAAFREWGALITALAHAGAEIVSIPQREGLEDMVFTANAGLLLDEKTVLLSNFKHSRRVGEQEVFRKFFLNYGYRVTTLSDDVVFEGQGDALWWGEDLIVSYGFRSHVAAASHLQGYLRQHGVIPMRLVDSSWYHGDTCCSPLTETLLLWYPDAFDADSQERLRRYAAQKGKELLAVTRAEALAFVCNAIPVGNTIILPKPPKGSTLVRRLRQKGFTVVTVSMEHFLLSGGAARCLAFNLNLIRLSGV